MDKRLIAVRRTGANRVFGWLMAVVYGGLAILGTQLHQMAEISPHSAPGAFWSAECCRLSGAVACRTFCSLGGQSEHPGKGLFSGVPHGNRTSLYGKVVHDPAHCSICQYLGQAKFVGQSPDPLGRPASAAASAPVFWFYVPAVCVRSFYARAPPSGESLS